MIQHHAICMIQHHAICMIQHHAICILQHYMHSTSIHPVSGLHCAGSLLVVMPEACQTALLLMLLASAHIASILLHQSLTLILCRSGAYQIALLLMMLASAHISCTTH